MNILNISRSCFSIDQMVNKLLLFCFLMEQTSSKWILHYMPSKFAPDGHYFFVFMFFSFTALFIPKLISCTFSIKFVKNDYNICEVIITSVLDRNECTKEALKTLVYSFQRWKYYALFYSVSLLVVCIVFIDHSSLFSKSFLFRR